METGITTRRLRNGFQRGGVVLSIVAVSAAVCVSSLTSAYGYDTDYFDSLRDRQAIEQLAYCYASGTDAIGRGDVAAGTAIYNKCFTPNAVFEASFANPDPNAPPDFVATGPGNWATVVNNQFTSQGYVATQHLMSNVQIDLHWSTATMSTYLSATHVIDPSASIDLANGPYVFDVVRTPIGWRITRLQLKLISFLRLESPPPAP